MNKLLAFLAVLVGLTVLSGCSEKPVQSDFFAMDTAITLTVYGTQDDLSAVRALLSDIELAASATDPQSQLYALDRDGEAVLSEYVLEPLKAALDIAAETGGAFDPTVYPAVRAWGFPEGELRVPDEAELSLLRDVIGYEGVAVDGSRVTLMPGMAVDLGGIAKGYAGQTAAALLTERGVTSAILSLGGNVQCVGGKPDGSPWRVGIRDPQSPEDILGVVEVKDCAVVTAGGYQRFFRQNGATYVHILDPKTAAPAVSDLLSVTVIHEDGTFADGLSTALYVMGKDAAIRWCGKHDIRAVLVDSTGAVVCTDGVSLVTE